MLIRGSEIDAGKDAKLTSDGTLDILAAADTSEHHRTSSGVSGGIGVAVSLGANTPPIGVTASASASRGKADGKDVTNRSSHIVAGGDTNIRSGTVVGERVVANVGGDLNIESLQDTSVYASKDQSINGSVTVGFGGASGSINVSHQQINSDFASVTEQSGIKAGDGGFDVTVKGNTDLTGAVIASTDKAADENRNRLKTGSLTTRDVENHAEYDAFGVSLGGGISAGFGQNAKVGTDQKGDAQTGATATPGSELPKTGAVSVAPPVVVAAGDSASSSTRSGISAGVIEITDEAGQLERTGKTAEETVAAVNRDVSSDKDGSGALANKFDKEQIETSFEIMQTLQREVGTFVGNRAKEADELKKARDKETDPNKRAELDSQLADATKWGPGGDYRLIVSAITAGISGNVTGAAGEMATRATVNYLQGLAAKEIKTLGENLDPASKAALHAVTGCAGGAASSGNCDAGAMGAAAGSLLGSLLATGDKSRQDLSQSEREARVNLITSIVAGVTAGVGGDVATASISAKTEAENNTLGVRVVPPPPRHTGGPLGPEGGTRGGRDSDDIDPTSAGRATTPSASGNVAERLKDALTKAACAISGLACSNQLIVDGVVARVIGDGANDDNVMGTPNEGPRGVTVTGTPDTGAKGPTIIGTPDQGERGATITGTPDQGEKELTVIATPISGPIIFDPMLSDDGSPPPQSLSDEDTRRWYHAQLEEIPSKLDPNASLRERALEAFRLRNEAKMRARTLMIDQEKANSLDAPKTLSEVIHRARELGFTGDDIWSYILGSSGRSNASVDQLLGIKRKNQ
ncbi:hemagglutinin-related protein [Pandoraea eparura]|uniref:Hemagglutinin-related protein n=1 Tax=Pandoraea eparura TaxID=2508291 RepID=A0A5E4XDZ2_9BURK|nr:hemagglutinin repeat-containing protein [Pandoraea eparura]VVE34496.1 hemagglutinin-related protein [Pandoraea eparura]